MKNGDEVVHVHLLVVVVEGVEVDHREEDQDQGISIQFLLIK